MTETHKVTIDGERYYTLETEKVPQDSNRHLMQCTKCKDRFVVMLDKAYPDIDAVRKIDGIAQRIYRCPHGCKVESRDSNNELMLGEDRRPIFVYAQIVPFIRRKKSIGEHDGKKES